MVPHLLALSGEVEGRGEAIAQTQVKITIVMMIMSAMTVIRIMMMIDNDDDDDHNDDDDGNDDIYIMVKCLYVCNVFAYFYV